MATFLPGITDAIPDTPLYHPDMGYFNQMLMKKTQMYNQGLSQVQSAYSSVLNAPLTDQENISRRSEYVAQAQDKLKDLSSADLSLDSNVQAAQNVYAPFWQDDLMIKDVAYTKSAQSEMQKGVMYRDSTDEKQRALYNETSMQDIQNGLNQLKTAGRDSTKYAQLQSRRFTPFINVPQTLDAAAKDENLKIDWTGDPNGPYLVNQVNGERSIKSFRAFAEGHMTPQMHEQFNVTGRVEFENRVNQYKQNNPGATDQQARDYITKDATSQYADQFKTVISGFTADRNTILTQLDTFKKNIGSQKATPEQIQYIQQLKAERDNLSNQIEAKNTEFNQHWQTGGDNFEQVHQNIAANPEHYFASMAKNSTIMNWAIGRAANESRTITENPVWKTTTDNDYKKKELEIDAGKLDIEKQNLDLKREALGLKYGQPGNGGIPGKGPFTLDANGNLVKNPDSEKAYLTEGHIIGKDVLNVTKLADPASLYYADQLTKTRTANDLISSPDGLAGILTNVGNGVTHEDVVNISSSLKNMLRDPDGYHPNEEQKASTAKVWTALAAQTGMKITGPGSFRNALVAYAGKYFTDRKNNAATPLTDEEKQQIFSYTRATDLLNELDTDAALKQKQTQIYLANSKDPDLNKLIISREKGKIDLLNQDDLARYLHPIPVRDENGNITTLSSKQLATSFITGNEDALPRPYSKIALSGVAQPHVIQMDGHTYSILDPKTAYDNVNEVKQHFGEPAVVAQKLRKAQQAIIPNLPQYNAKTGGYGTVTQYDIPNKDPKDGPAEATFLAQEIANPANHTGIYIDGELSKDDKLNKAILAMAGNSQDGEHHNIVSVVHHTLGVTGTPSLELKFNPTLSANDKHMIGEEKLSALAGKSIELPIAPDASGEHIDKLPSGSNTYVYGSLMNGKAQYANAISKGLGFDYTVKPDDPNHPTGAYVYVNRNVHKNGSINPVSTKQVFIPFSGPYAKNPDEIMNSINQAFQAHLAEDDQNRTLYQNAHQDSNGITINELIDGK